MQWAKQTGFTIVELLIVVVVIAILAAITLVSFNGITERARVSTASNYAAQLKHRDLADASGFWSFDECGGSTVGNSGGMAAVANATVTGTLTWSNDTPSNTGCSVSFSGSLSFNTNISLSNDYYRKSAWIKTTGGNIISDSAPGNNSAFYITGGKPSSGHNGSWSSVQGSTVADGKWHFVTVEFTRNSPGATTGTMSISIDGTVSAINTNIPVQTNPTAVTQIVGAYNGGNGYYGLMDDVMIVTR
jgi:prepilin-type N-terminal cleavage/methylation domain-containing protein